VTQHKVDDAAVAAALLEAYPYRVRSNPGQWAALLRVRVCGRCKGLTVATPWTVGEHYACPECGARCECCEQYDEPREGGAVREVGAFLLCFGCRDAGICAGCAALRAGRDAGGRCEDCRG
jgi:hypothetical protein